MISTEAGDWAGRDVLVVAPHPDDEALGAGGSVHLLARAGARVTVVVMTRGDGGIDPSQGTPDIDRRREESLAGCRELGTSEPLFMAWTSADLRDDVAGAAARLAEIAGRESFDLILVPSPLERHATHRASLLAALLAGVDREGARWWGYGAWDAIPAWDDVLEMDVTSARMAKTLAVRAHRSQDGARGLAAAILSRDAAHAAFSQITGHETRKAVERLLDLSVMRSATRAVSDPRELAERVGAWVSGRAAAWLTGLWAPASPGPGPLPA